jgi:flagellar biogenesis protein FliO
MVKRFVVAALLVGTSLFAPAQAPAPGQSERELQEKFVPDDGKPTPASAGADAAPSGWRALGSMLLVLGLAGGGLWAFRKWGAGKLPGSGGGRLKVDETLALGDRRFVAILRVDEERFLIALSPNGVTLMTRLDSVEAGGPTLFSEALERKVDLNTPMAVKDMEAMIRRGEA